ncbi:MAG TPA: murein biosynthesis integral membrane protein MurJ [Pyrinomonadaceae bacterium]|jgi:putative peptidoglycan lipid II flippase|nr:murein biosynthesis integral membrane protein MurJ [Pyrinomonadaceae bacterium]
MRDLPNDGANGDETANNGISNDDPPEGESSRSAPEITENSIPEVPPVPGVVHDEASSIAGETIDQVGAAGGEMPPVPPRAKVEKSSGRSAFMVGAGILISRIVGLARQRVFAHYFGTSAAGDAFSAAFRIPNFLQNIFGEGALSASFIPVYAKLLAQDDEKEAGHVANAVLGILALAVSLIVLIGVLTTPYLISLIAPGFHGETRELTIRLVRILFPGAGLLVLSAWCLGVLNSHQRFFISYTAPVAWNLAMIASLIVFGRRVGQFPLAEYVAWGSVIGSGLQFAVQWPTVMKLMRRIRPVIDVASVHVKTVIKNFFPVFMSRGVVQISAFVDAVLASFLPVGSVVALTYAQSLYTLPVSLFGMSVSAAELPAMSRAVGSNEEVADVLRARLDAGLRRIAFFIVPSSMAFLALGDVIAAVLYQTGQFKHDAAIFVWGILAGSTVGLLASTLGRLYSSTYYALHDTRTPLRYAIVRVTLTTVLGYICALPLPRFLGIDPKWGVAGLTASAGVAGWIEFALLRRSLNRRIGRTGLSAPYVIKLWVAALLAADVGWTFKLLLGEMRPIPLAAVVLGGYGITYFGVGFFLELSESQELIGRILRLVKFRK